MSATVSLGRRRVEITHPDKALFTDPPVTKLDLAHHYENVAEARQGITAYFEFYNHQRLHQALAYRTPRQVFDEAAPLASSARGKNAGACPTLSAQ